VTQIVTLSLFRFAGPLAKAWAFVMMGGARWHLSRTPDIGFWKLCGTGTGEGFTPVPNTAVYAILATWPDIATAQARMQAGLFARYRARATEDWTVFLQTRTARGQWSGQQPFVAVDTTGDSGPLAALTRATLSPRNLTRFWNRVPDISAMIGQDSNVMFKIGIGEVPMLQQVTFSIWPSERAMASFARTGPHADAIRAVRDEGWFKEELYARFAVHSDSGTWNGTSPLARKQAA
jgi:spheroidene monooxygenase